MATNAPHPAARAPVAPVSKSRTGGVDKPKKRRAPSRELEFKAQSALIKWARNPAVKRMYPGIHLLSCSLNGVKLSKAQAGKASAAGMLEGEHDLRLPCARGGFCGLSIEMKAGTNKPTEKQVTYGEDLVLEGWRVEYCWDWLVAKHIIQEYLSAPRRLPQDAERE